MRPFVVLFGTSEQAEHDARLFAGRGVARAEAAVGHAADVYYTEARTGDILRSVLSNDALKQTLGIVPAMKLPEGIKKTYAWYQNQQSEWK